MTVATYQAVLARYFKPDGCWNMRNIQFRKSLDGGQLLSAMDRTAVLYRPGDERGIIPFNFNMDSDGKVTKGQFLSLADEPQECGPPRRARSRLDGVARGMGLCQRLAGAVKRCQSG